MTTPYQHCRRCQRRRAALRRLHKHVEFLRTALHGKWDRESASMESQRAEMEALRRENAELTLQLERVRVGMRTWA